MLIINLQADSKEPIKEARKDQQKRKTARQDSTDKREGSGCKEGTTGPRADRLRNQEGFKGVRRRLLVTSKGKFSGWWQTEPTG